MATLFSPSNTSELAANREVKRGARCAARLFSPPFRRFARNDAAAFTAPAAACVATYAVAVSRDPGCVPPAFVPDVEDNESPIHEIKRKGGDLRSQKCSRYKPPHAHHCRVCKRCVLRMDHHCIWINNCVGHENYKVFLVFVLYAVIGSFYSMVLQYPPLLNQLWLLRSLCIRRFIISGSDNRGCCA